MNADLLSAITASARQSANRREQRSAARVHEAAQQRAPRGAAFVSRLSAPTSEVAIIAECKQRSPSRGILRRPYDPVAIASGYEAAGAAAISVLTEPSFFDGALDHLAAVRAHVGALLLRKDFITTRFQVVEARAVGADAVLLIVGALDQESLVTLLGTCAREGLAALVEVHSAPELQRALAAGATLIGVNSRNLKTLEVDLRVFDTLIGAIPAGVTAVAESGLQKAEDVRRLRHAGYHAFLIGERFMTTPDPGAALAALIAEVRG